jgi:hypothetical protein
VSISIVFLVYLCLVIQMVDIYMPVAECGYVPFFADVIYAANLFLSCVYFWMKVLCRGILFSHTTFALQPSYILQSLKMFLYNSTKAAETWEHSRMFPMHSTFQIYLTYRVPDELILWNNACHTMLSCLCHEVRLRQDKVTTISWRRLTTKQTSLHQLRFRWVSNMKLAQ